MQYVGYYHGIDVSVVGEAAGHVLRALYKKVSDEANLTGNMSGYLI